MNPRPNILIFCTDEQRGDHLGCMGHPDLKTPNIDRIAAEGTLFRNCYSSSPVCMPARATMATGVTNRVHGVVSNGFDLPGDIPTLPGMLDDAGYRTHAIGKLHLAGRGGRDIDDDEDFSVHPERRIYWDWPGHWEGACYKEFPDNYFGFQTVELAQGHVHYIYGDYVTWLEENHPGAYAGYKCSNADPHPLAIEPELHYNTWIADRTIAFIKDHVEPTAGSDPATTGRGLGHAIGDDRQQSAAADSNRSGIPHSAFRVPHLDPFFLWCSFPDPHEPFAAVKKWSDFYDDVDIELPRNTLELSPGSRSETMTRLELGTEVIDPELVKKSIKQTYGMISHLDEQVGRVLDTLEETGIADNTVVMFISDHGDQLGEHGLFYKSIYPYDAHMHVPFVVKAPGATEQGKVVDDVVSMLDLVPTALDLAGIDPPPELPGEVLTPVVQGDAAPRRKNALVELDRTKSPIGVVQMRGLVTNDWKLVHYMPTDETMLFDRRNDSLEATNLASDPAHRDIVRKMREDLANELARTDRPGRAETAGEDDA